MMKKQLAISILLLYIIASSGVAIRAHYSSGKLTSINLVLDSSQEKATAKPVSEEVLNFVSVVSGGFFKAYDDTDSVPACTMPTCQGKMRVSMLMHEG